jgi:hypothetical protein
MSPSRDARFTGASVVDWEETNRDIIKIHFVAGALAQAVQHLPGKSKTLSSTPVLPRTKQNKKPLNGES